MSKLNGYTKKNYFFLFLFLLNLGLITPLYAASLDKTKQLKTTEQKQTQEWVSLLLEVNLNDAVLPDVIRCYQDKDQRIWVNSRDLHLWRIRYLPRHVPRQMEQEIWYPLDAYPELTYQVDPYTMQLIIRAPAHLFLSQAFESENQLLGALRPSKPGIFVNYDAIAARNETQNTNNGINENATQNNTSVLLNVGFFNRWGVGTADFLGYNRYYNRISDLQEAPNKFLRLNTTWTLDQPEKIASWRFGDSITGSTYWSGAVRFAGIQYATNFDTQPNLITFPLPAYRGEAAIPSTVDVFVNNVLNQEKSVNMGPYSINDIPVISGAGTVKIVTKDLLGRSQAISFPYYVSPRLLKPHLSRFSYEVGVIRNDYSVVSNGYGRALGVLTYERGITRNLTLGTHAELLSDQQSLGFSANYLLNNYGVIALALSGGHNEQGGGGLAALSFSRQGSEFSYGFNSIFTSTNYLQIGDQPDASLSRVGFTNQFFVGYNLKDYGSLSLSYTMVNSRIQNPIGDNNITSLPSTRLITGTYSRSLFRNISLGLGFVGDPRNSQANQAFVSILFAPENSPIINSYTNSNNGRVETALQFTKPTPLGLGYGYNLLASNEEVRHVSADLTLRNNYGAYAASLAKGQGSTNYELDASGSVIYFAGDLFIGRKLTNSFALVKVPNYKNVDVLYQHQLMGRTNAKGNLLIPDLLPYQQNNIEIDPISLPLNTSIRTTHKTVVPYFYSGVLVNFPVHSLQGLMIHLKQANGQFVPMGAEVTLQEDARQTIYTVGYDGAIYLPDVTAKMIHGQVQTKTETCTFEAMIPNTTDPIIELGEILCHI